MVVRPPSSGSSCCHQTLPPSTIGKLPGVCALARSAAVIGDGHSPKGTAGSRGSSLTWAAAVSPETAGSAVSLALADIAISCPTGRPGAEANRDIGHDSAVGRTRCRGHTLARHGWPASTLVIMAGTASHRSFEIRTYGCQMNMHDSERLAGLLEAAGYQRAATGTDPDVVVFNTCAVRENADNRLYGNLGHLLPVKNSHPG